MKTKSILNLLKATKRIALWSAVLTGLAVTGWGQTIPAPSQATAAPTHSTHAAANGFKIEETLLGQWNPSPCAFCRFALSSDNLHATWVTTGACKFEGKSLMEKSQVCVFLDGKPIEAPPIDGITIFGLTAPGPHSVVDLSFSPDGKHIAYKSMRKDKQWVLVVDSQASAEYDEVRGPYFSPDNKRVAYEAKKDEKWLVVVDGQAGAEYDGIWGLKFSPDSKHVAYAAKKGEKWLVVVDGLPGAEYDGIGDLYYSHDTKRVAYTAKKGEKWVVVVDEHAGAEYDGIWILKFSPDDKRVAYVANMKWKHVVVVDGQAGVEYDGIRDLYFSPDSNHVVYAAKRDNQWSMVVDGQEGVAPDVLMSEDFQALAIILNMKRIPHVAQRRKQWSVMTDGQPGAEYDEIIGLSVSPDGKHVAYAARKDKQWSVVVDGKQGAEYDEILSRQTIFEENYGSYGYGGFRITKFKYFSPVKFSPDGKHVVYAARRGKQWTVVMDGQPSAEYNGIFDLDFSPDCKGVTYIAARKRESASPSGARFSWTVVIDGKPSPEYDEILDLRFSPDGKRVAYAAMQDKKWSVIVDGQAGTKYDEILGPKHLYEHTLLKPAALGMISSIEFSPDGQRVLYGAKTDNKWVAVVDGKASAEYDNISYPLFSPDGQHVAYFAGTSRMWSMIVDGQASTQYSEIVGGFPTFGPDGGMEFLAVKGTGVFKATGTLYRVKYIPVP